MNPPTGRRIVAGLSGANGLVEPMAAGRPLATSAAPQIEEFLAHRQELEHLGAEGRRVIGGAFSLERIVRDHEGLFLAAAWGSGA